ncbi:ribosome assembly RNA-binding protein YhbY [Terrilactibacillus laevilacticus]|uniref:Ribosome assembly RNA-binding protein YhbY n=1 Tax=Terrilactibacillus laevilacticus TaxID=1380157 RepID=A0ABW5PTG6_9BACI|nr:ribosome assembly RNA-binding protein YhbY [Terrilactibacillus laevilacticus]
MLTSKQKKFLKKEAHHLKPVFQIGKSGLHHTVIEELNAVLEARELIKVNFLQNTLEDPKEAGEQVAEKIGAEVVQVIGNVLVLYKESENNKTIELPRA